MSAHVLLVGTEQLTMSASDTLVKSLKYFGATVARHPISGIVPIDDFAIRLSDATHLFLVLAKNTDKIIVAEFVRIVHDARLSSPQPILPRHTGVIFLDAEALKSFDYLTVSEFAKLAVIRNEIDRSRISNKVILVHSVDDMTSPGACNDLALAFLGNAARNLEAT